jgi:hypothetical protein
VKTLYLQKLLSINGRNSLIGRDLADALREASDDWRLAHVVRSSVPSDPRIETDVLTAEALELFKPDLVYLEGGLFGGTDWRLPRELATPLVQSGCVVIVADVDNNEADHAKASYQKAADFLGVQLDYGAEDTHAVYGNDEVSFWESHRTIVCRPQLMEYSPWLGSAYTRVSEIVVGLPVRLRAFESLLASGNRGTSGTLQDDYWVDEVEAFPFAGVAALGSGYVVTIAGAVSDDVFTTRCPDNIRWILNLARLLVAEVARNQKLKRGKQQLN